MSADAGRDGDSSVPALRIANVSKTFLGVKALDRVSIDVAPGTIHALLGGNGSGKSTMIKILAGVYEADPEGTITVGGQTLPADQMTPERAHELGIRFVHQSLGLFPDLSVAENLAFGRPFARTRLGRIRWPEVRRQAEQVLARFGVDVAADAELRTLSPAQQTMVAVARSLQDVGELEAATLVLDEPTATLPHEEVEVLLAAIREFAGMHTVLYVSHRIDEILSIADRVTVLRDGRHAVTRDAAGLDAGSLVESILGRRLAASAAASAPDVGARICRVRGLSGPRVADVDLDVHAGEVVGIAGLAGSGRGELLRMLFGALPRTAGEVEIDGQPLDAGASIDEYMRRGVAYVPRDRASDAALADGTVEENLSLARLSRYWRHGRMDAQQETADATAAMERFLVRARGPEQTMATLSGGNQQKVILARWLVREPRLVLLDEPSQGVDVGARDEIHKLLRAATRAGAGALVVSSDFEELAAVADRIVVIRRGRLSSEVAGVDADAHQLTELAYA